MNRLRQYFGKTQAFTESQRWVVDQLIPIFPYHIRCGIEAVVGMQTVDVHPFDSRVLLQQCIDFLLDNSAIFEAAIDEYFASRIDLTGSAEHKTKQNEKINIRDQAFLIDSDEDEVELLRIMETAENGDGSLSNSSVPNWNNKTNHNKNFENKTSTSQSNGSGNISLTSAMANGMMLQTNSPGMNSFAKSKPDATTFNSVTMDSTMYSVPFSQLVNTVSMVPQTSWKSGSEFDTLKSPSSLSKSNHVGGVNVWGSANHSSLQEQVGGVSVAGSASHSSKHGQVGGVNAWGSANHSSLQEQMGGVNVAGSQMCFTTEPVIETAGTMTAGNHFCRSGDMGGVSGAVSANQSSTLECVGGALMSPSLTSSLPLSPSSLCITTSPSAVTCNSDSDVNRMPAPPKQSIQEQVEEMKQQVIQLFPNADPGYVTEQLRIHFGPTSVNSVCNMLLENPDYPKVQTVKVQTVATQQKGFDPKVDYFKDYNQLGCSYSEDHCSRVLQNEFQKVSVRDISQVLRMYNGHYAPTYKAFFDAMEKAYSKTADQKIRWAPKAIKVEGVGGLITVNLLKGKRSSRRVFEADPQLEKEIEFVKRKLAAEKQEADEKFAWQVNETEYEDTGQLIECCCCFGEHPFESMVQCYDGHLFCRDCLLNYAKEAVYGSGKLGLACMASDCESSFPVSELKRTLPGNLLKQYEERIRESDLNMADLEDLVRCPHCDYAAIMAPGDKVFKCQTQTCMKETCRYCKEEWSDHIGIPCSELEKKDESHLRKQYEERMTEAKVRTCHRCKKKFTKEEGCNKMICTCRATMCYICRKQDIDYKHFCGHVREPGQPCTKCKACSLWTNPDEDDNRAIREIQEEAKQKRKEKGYEENKLIGAPIEPPAKKRKV